MNYISSWAVKNQRDPVRSRHRQLWLTLCRAGA